MLFRSVLDADVPAYAQIFNQPPLVMAGTPIWKEKLPEFARLPRVSPPLQVLAVKPPHLDAVGAGWIPENWMNLAQSEQVFLILRVVNSSLAEIKGKIVFCDLPVLEIKETDLLERTLESKSILSLDKAGKGFIRSVTTTWLPTELKTFVLRLKIKA